MMVGVVLGGGWMGVTRWVEGCLVVVGGVLGGC